MKKKIWIPILIVAVIAILVIPIPTGTYKDGGTREYTSLKRASTISKNTWPTCAPKSDMKYRLQ